ncbi:nucleolar protein 8 isoform X1 [Psammomys obesus]|uniref:nucleolar protein 8 isoform X1 n=2 Tax=Psammomys obesus TaxID=48139 RepID=UPI002452AC69|nr:nucleolar protein 8 isoform X1 [Psammomys obesus]XP_055451241.1 nucleolar protein 8 isoform X1 [Psammomys obesus]
MKASREMKRLFVGGLGQGISETDLKNQFSRFGEVSDVEIISRKDGQGNSHKVFAYVNIKITEADLKKCMSILNKTKWKGGTLQIQLAKESFLHRLAQEREEAKKEKSTTGSTTFLEKMGGIDFHMKAVPGTEVPGHKNWVVSKFGRVLPVLHLKNQHKHKIMKYDPSKYCHNLKKISEDLTEPIPISDLTWELEGGNDPMSKKRRGEFSDFHFPPQKIKKVQKSKDPMESKVSGISLRTNQVMENNKSAQPMTTHRTAAGTITPSKSCLVSSSGTQKPKHVGFHTSDFEIIQNKSSMSDDDVDSEDELKMMIAKEENLQKTRHCLVNESENDSFEVVRDDFKSNIHKPHSSTSLGNNCEYDSSDTDEIIAMKKNTGKVKNSTEFSQPEKPINKKSSSKNIEPSNDCIKVQKTKINNESAPHHRVKFLNPVFPPDSDVSDSEESEEDEEYKALMKNCPRLSLTLADLEQLAGSHQKVPGKDENSGPQNTNHCKFDTTSKSPKTSGDVYDGRQCILPEEIVASLLEEESTCSKQKPEENTLKPKFQAFTGIGCLYAKDSVGKTLKETVAVSTVNEHQNSLKHEVPNRSFIENGSTCANGSSSKLTSCQPAKVNSPNHIQPPKRQYSFESQSHQVMSSTSFDKGSKNSLSCLLPLKAKKSLCLSANSHKTDSDGDTCHQSGSRKTSEKQGSELSNLTSFEKPPEVSPRKDSQKSTAGFSLGDSCMNTNDKHAEDNQKRLAALAVRQKAREAQKKLVHNALANLDGHLEDKKTHIVFASDDESETEDTTTQVQSCPGEELVKESLSKASGKLFDSSDDEESESLEDSTRFNIKPQFEGRAGQKLMDLQSHFGSDERFRMDSRFLESDSEEEQNELNENKMHEDELAAERKKSLNVVQSVLTISLNNPTSKGSGAAKKFKDIIHYDPTKQDHAIYERKQEDKEKDSKAKRKKKREEAEKLPEVSQDMYYNIATDLKEIFQSVKSTDEKEGDVPWNEDCGRQEAEEMRSAVTLTSGPEQTRGFTFSFFDSDTKEIKEDTYRIEPVKRGKVVCQEDPRFQDSSSEEEDVTNEDDHRKASLGEAFPEKETTRFFFFSKNDDRLLGSNLFWSGVGSSFSRSSWEARTNSLLLDCRKKHKEAKRKLKAN